MLLCELGKNDAGKNADKVSRDILLKQCLRAFCSSRTLTSWWYSTEAWLDLLSTQRQKAVAWLLEDKRVRDWRNPICLRKPPTAVTGLADVAAPRAKNNDQRKISVVQPPRNIQLIIPIFRFKTTRWMLWMKWTAHFHCDWFVRQYQRPAIAKIQTQTIFRSKICEGARQSNKYQTICDCWMCLCKHKLGLCCRLLKVF